MIKKQIEYSIVIPVYNSEKTLQELTTRIKKIFTSEITKNYEIIFVDDDSRDNSWPILEKLHHEDKKVKIIQLTRNFGQQNALMCGFEFTKGKYIVTMDDDLQHPPEEILKLINGIKNNPKIDFVIGKAKEKKHSFIQNLGSSLLNSFYKKIFSIPKEIKSGPFRLIKKKIIKDVIKNKTKNPSISSILFSISKKVINVPFRHDPRRYGRSNYSLSKQITLFYNSVLGYSLLPIKLVSFIGFSSFALSIILSIFYIVLFFFGIIKVNGWITLVLLLLFFPGLILFSIGIIGEYIFQILKEVNSSAGYIIRKKIL